MSSRLTLGVSERDHVVGAEDAPVTLVEYGDYQCPYCGQAYPIVKELRRLLGSRVRFVFRNFPLREVHPHAEAAAEAAEAAGAQGKFWEMHDALFENQSDLRGAALLSYAARLVADAPRWTHDLSSHAFRSRVQEDFESGVSSGVRGTPTFYVNGRRHDGPFDLDSLLAAVQEAIFASRQLRTTSGSLS